MLKCRFYEIIITSSTHENKIIWKNRRWQKGETEREREKLKTVSNLITYFYTIGPHPCTKKM
jgi:hypothetical protein